MTVALLILSDIRFVRDGLTQVLSLDGTFEVAGSANNFEEARDIIGRFAPTLVLLDTSIPNGLWIVGEIEKYAPGIRIVAFAPSDAEGEVIAWAAAGITGYIPRSTPLEGLAASLKNILEGKQECPLRVASGMLRWIARHAPRLAQQDEPAPTVLTPREEQIAGLLGTGLSNKDIARRLNISVATTKSHVHNVLSKLGVERRTQAADRLPARRPVAPASAAL